MRPYDGKAKSSCISSVVGRRIILPHLLLGVSVPPKAPNRLGPCQLPQWVCRGWKEIFSFHVPQVFLFWFFFNSSSSNTEIVNATFYWDLKTHEVQQRALYITTTLVLKPYLENAFLSKYLHCSQDASSVSILATSSNFLSVLVSSIFLSFVFYYENSIHA